MTDGLLDDDALASPSPERQVLVVGDGVGGLALAGFLRQRGLTPVIVGAHSRDFDRTGGVVLSRAALELVAELGLRERLCAHATPVESWLRRTRDGGTVLEACDDDGPVAVERDDLRAVLSRVVPDDFCRSARTVDKLETGRDVVRVVLDDAVEERFDVVVGADGVDSTVRAAVGRATRVTTGTWTWTVPIDVGHRRSRVVDVWGRESGFTRLPGGDREWYRLTRAAEESAPGERRFTDAVAGADVDPSLPPRVDEGDVLAREVTRFESTEWAVDRVAFLGSAARSTHPAVGADASLAISDARALAAALTCGDGDAVRRVARYAERRDASRAATFEGPEASSSWPMGLLRAARLRWLRDIDRPHGSEIR
jgi:2-polyprenyl-6-methoxyphenol hydroxylase-like FAD-dependent oxidoreductase